MINLVSGSSESTTGNVMPKDVELALQIGEEDYQCELTIEKVLLLVQSSLERYPNGVWGHIFYGGVRSTAPILNFAYIKELGLFISINRDPHQFPSDTIYVLEANDDYDTTHTILWSQDRVIIPRAFCLQPQSGLTIIKHFCNTGDRSEDSRWRAIGRDVEWDMFRSD